jgi:hypothetical protein
MGGKSPQKSEICSMRNERCEEKIKEGGTEKKRKKKQ